MFFIIENLDNEFFLNEREEFEFVFSGIYYF